MPIQSLNKNDITQFIYVQLQSHKKKIQLSHLTKISKNKHIKLIINLY